MVDQEDNENIKKIREKVEARRDEEEKLYAEEDPEGEGISSKRIMNCLNANELGDGILFCELNQDQFLYNKSAKEWMTWSGHHWERDIMEASLAACDDVVDLYLEEYSNICNKIREAQKNGSDSEINISKLQDQQKQLLRRAGKLRSRRGRENCLHFAHSNRRALAIKGNEIDCKPWLLACPNGVIDLRTGKKRKGIQGDHLLKAAAAEWKGIDAERKLWEQTLLEIYSDNQDLVDFVQRACGCAIVGERTEDILVVLNGRGRNGKGLIVETISYVLGDLAGPISSDMLLDQGKYKSSASPTPDIMALRGLRIAFSSETDEHRKFSTSRIKLLTGGGEITGRNPHDKYPSTFTPTHTLFLETNHRPHAPDDDFAFWQRIIIIPFRLSFIDPNDQEDAKLMHFLSEEDIRKKDKSLPKRLQEEASGILAWLVEGCLKWQQQGLDPPEIIREESRQYQRDESLLGSFIEDNCIIEKDAEIGATEIYKEFEKWYEETISGHRVPKQKKFGKMMTRRFEKRKINGVYRYFGIKLAPIGDDSDSDQCE